jgi:uncharacterized membrane protein
MRRLRKYLITGLVLVVPVTLTLYVLIWAFNFIDSILGRFLNVYLKATWGFYIPGVGFVLFFLVLILVGMIATRFLGRKLFIELEKWFAGLPLIKNIYPTLKQIILFMSNQKELGFKRVVLIEYPGPGVCLWGF